MEAVGTKKVGGEWGLLESCLPQWEDYSIIDIVQNCQGTVIIKGIPLVGFSIILSLYV